jgi:hypothetical protein
MNRLTVTRQTVFAAVGLIVLGLYRVERPSGQEKPANVSRAGVCEREAEKLLGQKPVRIGGSIPAPNKVRSVPPHYPELPHGTTGSGMWIGEVLIDKTGKAARVWPIREVILKPAFPIFNQAIVDSVGSAEYEPVLLNGAPTPFCMTVTVSIELR